MRYLFLLIIILFNTASFSENIAALNFESEADSDNPFLLTTAAGVFIITLWGTIQWDYFSTSPKSESEGWFKNDTKYGGADKLGHLYMSYLTSQSLSCFYENYMTDKEEAAFYGSMTSFIIMSYMELGDSFSSYGFSHEDFIANLLGSVLGYYLRTVPSLAEKIDLRWEYGLKPNSTDFTTDYENSKYLLALKLAGFNVFEDTFLKFFEIHLGYYTRGFEDDEEDRSRNIYAGIGFNLTDFFQRRKYHKTASFFRYIQLPESSINFEKELDD